jgi:polar amino acid transport system ATP-binding protein/sulfate transport system ATP-binding protein
MADGDILLDVKDVSQTLGGNRILDKLTFQVKDRVRPGHVTGQVVALLGPSGVGKTRLLRLIAQLDEPDTGTVRGAADAPIAPGSVGVVFQNYPLLRHRTVRDNLIVAGLTNDMSRAEARKRSDELLARFGLAHRATLYPMQLSGGQRQRAAIAQQLVKHKSMLLLDEPFSGLDPAALDEVIELLIETAHMDEGNTLIIVTHDIRAAMVVADTVLMLGRTRGADGKPNSGAHIRRTFDMVALGLAWREDVEFDPAFAKLEREIKNEFKTL